MWWSSPYLLSSSPNAEYTFLQLKKAQHYLKSGKMTELDFGKNFRYNQLKNKNNAGTFGGLMKEK